MSSNHLILQKFNDVWTTAWLKNWTKIFHLMSNRIGDTCRGEILVHTSVHNILGYFIFVGLGMGTLFNSAHMFAIGLKFRHWGPKKQCFFFFMQPFLRWFLCIFEFMILLNHPSVFLNQALLNNFTNSLIKHYLHIQKILWSIVYTYAFNQYIINHCLLLQDINIHISAVRCN